MSREIVDKVCRDCKQVKPRVEFYKANSYDQMQPYCIPCHNLRSKSRRLKSGMTAAQLKRTTNGLCSICSQPRGDRGTGSLCRPHADQLIVRNRNRRQALIEQGLCVDCKSPLPSTVKRQRCDTCARNANRADNNLRFLMKQYGISKTIYFQMVADQNGVCAICGKPNVNGKRLFVDHCHNSKKVRGLLCSLCNTGLGSFKDSPELLSIAIEYLRQHR